VSQSVVVRVPPLAALGHSRGDSEGNLKTLYWVLIALNYLVALTGLSILVFALAFPGRAVLVAASLPLVVGAVVAVILTEVALIAMGNREFRQRGLGMLTLLRKAFGTAPFLGWISVVVAVCGLVVAIYLFEGQSSSTAKQGAAAAGFCVLAGAFFAMAAFASKVRKFRETLETSTPVE
jgi:hypothetical protein